LLYNQNDPNRFLTEDVERKGTCQMPSDDVIQRVRSVVAKNKGIAVDAVSLDSTFADLGMDSLDAVNLLFALEEEFDISIPDSEARAINSVQGMVAGVETLLAKKSAETGSSG
jgi:acyl carrier protein